MYFFSAFDHNNDGSISKEELREAMTRYGQMFSAAECEEMFREADANGDGSIDFEEFLKMMMEDQDDQVSVAETCAKFCRRCLYRDGKKGWS